MVVKGVQWGVTGRGMVHTYLLVLQDLAALHGAHHGRIDGVAPIPPDILHHPLALIRRRPGNLQKCYH